MSIQQQEHDDDKDDDSVLNDVLPAPEGSESTEPMNTPGDNPYRSVSLKDDIVADHGANYLAALPMYRDMQAVVQIDSQVKQIEEINILHELDGYVNGTHPLAFTARANAADTPNYWQVMHHPDAYLFEKAMKDEIKALVDLDAWEVIDECDVPDTPEGIRRIVINSTWAFNVKRFPNGSIKKYKAHLCMRGDQQIKDVDHFETFSPVVSWSTVRMVMTLAADFPKGKEVYMAFPCGWEESGKVLKLTKT
eukprot:15325924-Ditylum_brightwellii.AAC.1